MVEKEIKSEPSLPPDYVSLAQLQERWLQKQQEKNKMKERQQQVEEEKKQSAQNENKNQRGVKITTELPPDYVSLAQLQERWLKNQQEKKLKEKELEEKKQSEQNEYRNQKGVKATINGHEKMEARGRIYGREMGAIEEKGKGKEIVSGENSLKGRVIEEGISVSMVEVLPRNVKGMGHRGGLRRNGDSRGSVYKGKREYVVKQHHTEVSFDLEKGIEGGKGYDDKLTEKSVNGDSLDKDYSVNESNKMELKLDGVKRRDGNGLLRQRNNSRNWRYGKFENGRKTEQRDGTSNGMVWVKKEEK